MSRAKQLSKTALVAHTWESGWVPLGEMAPPGEDDAGVLLTLDVNDGQIVGAQAMPSPDPRRMATMLVQLMLRPATGQPRRPEQLRVTDQVFADALAAEAGPLDVRVVPSLDALEPVAADLLRSLEASRPTNVPPLPDTEDQAQLFRTAAAFYNSRPWRYLGTATPLLVEIEGHSRVAAMVLGSAAVEFGLTIFTDSATIEPLLMGRKVNLEESRSISVTFTPEARVAPSWRELRRARRWPLASPSAFPAALTHERGNVQLPTEAELWLLDSTLAAVASLVATQGPALERRELPEHSIDVPKRKGAGGRARVTLRSIRDVVHEHERTAAPEQRALEAVIRAAMSLPDAAATLARLAWSFYRDSGPSHVKPGADTEAAEGRFLSWAVFAARPRKKTLAQRGLESISTDLDPATLAIAKRIVRPRIGLFRVGVATQSNKPGVYLYADATGKPLFLAASSETLDIEPGQWLLGTLHPVGRGEVLMGEGCITAQGPREAGESTRGGRPEDFGPTLEEAMFGASAHWIEVASPRDVREAYDGFRAALAGTGDDLPSYADFQRQISRAAMPLDIFRHGLAVTWWTETEVGVMMAFLMRIWNLSPRPELGGRSPDQAAGLRESRHRRR